MEVSYETAKSDLYHFEALDYVVFGAMLLVSALTGCYFGCRKKYRQMASGTLSDYLRGSNNMRCFPVAMSLVASYISGVTILGTPAEIYNFGTQYSLIVVGIWLSGAVVATVYLPVFFKLGVYSSYEYLELRFNRVIRTGVSVLFVIDEFLFTPILIYVPSLAFNQVSGINLHIIAVIVCLVCIFYTYLGGIEAVVWADTFQIIIMFLSMILITILGTVYSGGFANIWEINKLGGRLEFFNFSPSMYTRQTFPSVLIGGFFYWTSYNAVNQVMVQRYLSVPTFKKSVMSVAVFTVGVSFFVWLCCYCGVLIYAKFYDCDPFTSGRTTFDDQLLPLYVMEIAGHLQGIPGIFIAGVFGAALSSLSVALNSTSTVILEDFVKGCLRLKLSEKSAFIVVKVTTLALGFVALAAVGIVELLGGILSVATSLSAIAAGTSFGIFSLGMLVPWSNTVGAAVGGTAGAIIAGIISFGSQYATAAKLITSHRLPVSVDKCDENYGIYVNYTQPVLPDETDVFPLFRLSFHWITPISVSTVLIVGSLISLLVGKTDLRTLDPDLISPACKWILPKESQENLGVSMQRLRKMQLIQRRDSVLMTTEDVKEGASE